MQDDRSPHDESNQKFQPRRSLEGINVRQNSWQRRQARFGLPTNRSFTPTPAAQAVIAQEPKKTKRPAFWHKMSFWGKLTFLVFVLGTVGGIIYFNAFDPSSGELNNVVIDKKPKITTVASPLTGVQVTPELSKRPVTAIMIENSLDARPQSGLAEAGIVFEAIAEGGITRFIALYQEDQPTYIGPVRSLRPYYLDWAIPFDASIAHVGGSPEALAQIRNDGKDLDQFFNAGSYWRQNTRGAPHNVYTSFEHLNNLNQSKGYNSASFVPWVRKEDKPLTVPIAKSIDMPISSPLFYAHFDYHAQSNNYGRSEGGAPHMSTGSPTDTTGKQISPRVVIVLVMPYGIASDGQHSEYGTYGSGSAYVFQDGGVTPGTWHKADRNTQLSFKDANGELIKLNAGQTWVTMVSNGQMSYKP